MKAVPSLVAAAVAAVALLVATPIGFAVGFSFATNGTRAASVALAEFPFAGELASAVVWVVGVFAPLRWLARRLSVGIPFRPAAFVVVAALGSGILFFYRSESIASRFVLSTSYAVLVVLAFLLFDALAVWLGPAPPLRRSSGGA